MSKEMDLLKRILATGWLDHELSCEVEELLAQPEHIPDVGNMVEPVAWCQMVEEKVQDLLTTFEMKDWLYDKSWIPLYTAPPKREQLSDGELAVWYSQHTWAMDKQEYIWGFKDAEKCHGIGGGECVAT